MNQNQLMKAVRIHDYGGPEVLQFEESSVPQPGQGEVLVRVSASGVNPADWKRRSGMYKQFMPVQFPWIPGLEGSGTVESIGPGVTLFQPGQSVFGPFSGSYAEYALASEKDLLTLPANINFDQAATLPIAGLTAWAAVIGTGQAHPGQRVLVHGAAGGVGQIAVQLALWKGSYVMATTSTPNIPLVKSLGVEQIIDYTTTPFEQVARDVDLVVDTVGGDLPDRSLNVLRRGGILASVGKRLPPEFGTAQGIQATSPGRAPMTAFAEIKSLVENGVIKPHVYRAFSLAQAKQAHELSQTGHGQGRIILQTGG